MVVDVVQIPSLGLAVRRCSQLVWLYPCCVHLWPGNLTHPTNGRPHWMLPVMLHGVKALSDIEFGTALTTTVALLSLFIATSIPIGGMDLYRLPRSASAVPFRSKVRTAHLLKVCRRNHAPLSHPRPSLEVVRQTCCAGGAATEAQYVGRKQV